jgi:hypothetical protein
METKNTPKNPIFSCDLCGFITNNKKDYKRHVLTPKHARKQKWVNGNKKPQIVCNNCKKKYNSRSGLYKHSKTCTEKYVDATDNCFHIGIKKEKVDDNFQKVEPTFQKVEPTFQKVDEDQTTQIYSLIMKQGEILESLIRKIGDTPCSTTNNNNNNNTQINMNVYLNETCKDAESLPQFIENIQLQLSDLISVNNEGLLNSTKNIFLKELQNTEQIKRPIQCTDIKRKILYVKEEGEWSKDVGNEKLKCAIRSLSQKHIPLVKNLTCHEGDKTLNSEEYVQVVKSATTDVLEETRGLQSAVREICQETYMKGGAE